MKRGIDEKSMGPMFPRLHVNDTEKGGPRAPPRNKMALYEQLGIPSQRFSGSNSTSNNAPQPSSSSQGGVSERGSFLPHRQTPRIQAADKTNTRYSDPNNPVVQQEQKKKQEDDDFRVPIFVQQSGENLDHSEDHRNKDNEVISPCGSAFSDHLTNFQKADERNNHLSPKVQSKETSGLNKSVKFQSNGNSQDHVADSQDNLGVDRGSNEIIRASGYDNRLISVRVVQQEVVRSPNDPMNGDSVSENSTVDSISGADISPDDVVGIIGQNHFWKARRAIINQQRVFGVQVFELHRLIKVQKLIAGLSQLSVENNAFLGPPAKASQIKKLPIEYALKSSINVPKLKDHLENPNDDTREFSTENAVEKTSFSSSQNSSGSTFTGYPLPPSDPKMGSWSLSQQPGHQWLIPVMSPTEGLIYKPYPGPGYMTPAPGPPPGNDVINNGYPPTHPHYQWPSCHPLFPPPAPGYFPPYGMRTMNPSSKEMNPNPFSMQYQNSCNVPTFAKFHVYNNEVQASTATGPSEVTENRDPLALIPTHPIAEGGVELPTRAIRVVPRNSGLATESVARIFQSIQEERKQQDPI